MKPQPAAQQSAVPTVEAEPCAEFSVRGRNYTWEPAPQKLIYCESGRIGPYFPDFSANRTTMHLKIEKIWPRFPTFSLRSFLPRRLLAGKPEKGDSYLLYSRPRSFGELGSALSPTPDPRFPAPDVTLCHHSLSQPGEPMSVSPPVGLHRGCRVLTGRPVWACGSRLGAR